LFLIAHRVYAKLSADTLISQHSGDLSGWKRLAGLCSQESPSC
jgi:hypothetical protein